MAQRYGATVSIAISGDSIVGSRGFTTYLERLQPGVFVLKLDARLADFEYTVNAQVLNPPVGLEEKWSTQTWKVMDPPAPRPPGSYIAVITSKDGVPTDIDFNVTAVTFN